jgi:hypothetical protein
MIRGLPQTGKGGTKRNNNTDIKSLTENDPLLPQVPATKTEQSASSGGFLRSRRPSRSPNSANNRMESSKTITQQEKHGGNFGSYRNLDTREDGYSDFIDGEDATGGSRLSLTSQEINSGPSRLNQSLQQPIESSSSPERQNRKTSIYKSNPMLDSQSHRGGGHPPLLEIPEEVYAVRKAALQVLKPLTSSWVSAKPEYFI